MYIYFIFQNYRLIIFGIQKLATMFVLYPSMYIGIKVRVGEHKLILDVHKKRKERERMKSRRTRRIHQFGSTFAGSQTFSFVSYKFGCHH